MRTRTTGRASTLAGASVLAVAAIFAVNGNTGSLVTVIRAQTNTAPVNSVFTRVPTAVRTETGEQPRRERTHRIYQSMNELAEQLRLEVNKTDPNPALVVSLEAKLRALANEL